MIVEILITVAIIIFSIYILLQNLHIKKNTGCNCGCNSCKFSNKCSDPTKNHSKIKS